MTFYLPQTPAFIVCFHPWGPGLYDTVGLAGSYGVAALTWLGLTWLGSLAAANAMARRGLRGPAERLLRRLTARSALARREQPGRPEHASG